MNALDTALVSPVAVALSVKVPAALIDNVENVAMPPDAATVVVPFNVAALFVTASVIDAFVFTKLLL